MQNQNQINSTKTNLKGELTYDDKVVQKIIGLALANVKGLLTVNGGFFSNLADKIVAAGIKEVEIRTILTCGTANGVCQKCYGRNLATGKLS